MVTEGKRNTIARYRKKNPDKIKEIRTRHRIKLKRDAVEAYGGKCRCCSEEQLAFLTIEHGNRDGSAHRELLGKNIRGTNFYAWLRKNGYPDDLGLQVLCANCQFATWSGECPHVTSHLPSLSSQTPE